MSRETFLDGVMRERGMTPAQRALITETLKKAGSPTALLELQRELSSLEGLRSGGRFGSEVGNVLRLALAGIEAEGSGDVKAWTGIETVQGSQDSGRIEIGEGAEPDDPSYKRAREWIRAAEERQERRRADDAERVAAKQQARLERQKENEARGTIPGLTIPPPLVEE